MTKTLLFAFVISATIIGCKKMNTHYVSHDMATGEYNTAESVMYKTNDAAMN